MKTYLVTGGAGFIGANYVSYLLKEFDDVKIVVLDALTYAGNLGTIAPLIDDERCYFVKGDITDRALIDSLFARHRFDVVVNFAAESHVDRSINAPQLFLQTNVLGTLTLLDCARRAWVTGRDNDGYPLWFKHVRFHQVSTDEVYGSLGQDGSFVESTPLAARSPYSASKASADLLVMAYHHTYHMPVSISRCSNNYGPCQFPEKLIPLIIKNALEGRNIPVYGKGLNVRDWLFVADHCRAIEQIIRQGKEGQVYNIGGNCECANIEMVQLTLRLLRQLCEEQPQHTAHISGKRADGTARTAEDIGEHLITHVRDRLGHDFRYAINAGKIAHELGWEPQTTLEEGMKKTVEWYLCHQDWVDEVTSGEYAAYYEKMYGA